VFDGARSAYVGFIAAPKSEAFATVRGVGLNPANGHYYALGVDGVTPFLLVSSGGATPVPQGVVYDGLDGISPITADPSTNRIFYSKFKGTDTIWEVAEDNSPNVIESLDLDLDQLTNDIEESEENPPSYASGVQGFGLRVTSVGGFGGVFSSGLGLDRGFAQLRQGDRRLTFATIGNADLRNSSASAVAQAVVPDENTTAERGGIQQEPGQFDKAFRALYGNDPPVHLGDAAAPVVERLEWPWNPAVCLDGGGEAATKTESQSGGQASVTCNLDQTSVVTTASSGPFSGAGISVATSEIRSSAARDPKLGSVSTTIAEAHGIRIPTPDGGTLSISRVATSVQTAARGRPGTTSSNTMWERRLEGIAVRDRSGNVTEYRACKDTDKSNECDPVIDALNEQLGFKMNLKLPRPEITTTPKGAFAQVWKSDVDFYNALTLQNDASRASPALELIVFGDYAEKSRLVIQFAGIESNSSYLIPAVLPPDVTSDIDDGSSTLGGLLGSVQPPATLPPPSSIGSPNQRPRVIYLVSDNGPRLRARTVAQSILTACVLLMFAMAISAAWRRWTMSVQLDDLGGSE
jgi:hypothetical protein